MPGMGGSEALEAIRARHPGVKVLLTSGYSEEEVRQQFSAMEVQGFLQKPYTGEQLLAHILPALEAAPAAEG